MSEEIDVRDHLAIIDVALAKNSGGGLDKFQEVATPAVIEVWKSLTEQDDGPALTLLGYCYWTGIGVPQDIEAAVRCFQRGAKKEISQAQYLLGQCYKAAGDSYSNQQNAFIWHSAAAKQGNDHALTEVARHLFLGAGVARDVAKARAIAESAARAGNLDAAVLYGAICLDSQDPADEKRAVIVLRVAAQNGSLDAQYLLAGCYEEGIGVEKDGQEAKRLYSQAADAGHASSARAHQAILDAEHFSVEQCENERRPDEQPSSPGGANQKALIRLQEALLSGSIDEELYAKLKEDLRTAGTNGPETSAARSTRNNIPNDKAKASEVAIATISGSRRDAGVAAGWLSKVVANTGKGLLIGAVVGGIGVGILTGNPGGAIAGALIGAVLCGFGGLVFAMFGLD